MAALAIDGGPRVRVRPLAPWPFFDDEAVDAATRVLRSGLVNYRTGQEGLRFEEEFAARVGSRFGVALANGTVALELALRVLDVGPGDEVVVPSRTFVATASAVAQVGATPVFADVDETSQTLTPATIAPHLGPRTRAVIAVHLAGWPCPMGPVVELCRARGIRVVEDCAQAHGARVDGREVGAWGDVAAFSFCQDKILTTAGEGGMLTCDDPELRARAWSFKDHGKRLEDAPAPGASFRYVHDAVGTNWRISELHAAVGRVALRRLDAWLARRREHAALLDARLGRLAALRVTIPPPGVLHAYYKYYAFVRPERLRRGWDRDKILQAIAAEGIPCFQGSCSEVYRERAFRAIAPSAPRPVARALGETSLMLLVHPTLEVDAIEDTCRAVEKVMAAASR
ncbi:MAG: DegT/DnrJ/EryC1/StrS aminotransferase family protein [Myxococcales bacterium]|nr:DegT/DnrJ/EryC1/StrS aminotransferase family protein [Myxococcales bacterium]